MHVTVKLVLSALLSEFRNHQNLLMVHLNEMSYLSKHTNALSGQT